MIGALSRMLPQMNILFFSFPLTLMLGLCTFYLIAPEMIDYFESLMGDMSTDMMGLLKAL